MSLSKFRKRVATHGLFGALKIVVHKSEIKRRKKAIFAMQTAEDRFSKIYETNHWNDLESRSGEGSTLENTAAIRVALPNIFDTYNINTMLDAPCGDFNWMASVTKETSVAYTGGDIVRPLIEAHQDKHQSDHVKFIHLDLTKGPIPKADLMFCRDCLFHLSYRDITRVFENFLAADMPLLLTTSSVAPKGQRMENADIETGDMRGIDLFSQPFDLSPDDVLETIEDFMISRDAERYMVLLSRSAVESMYNNLNAATAQNASQAPALEPQ